MNQKHIFKKLAQKYPNPRAVQAYLRTFQYHLEPTLQSALSSIHSQRAHCLEGAFVAAAILENLGYPPLVLSLESQDDIDHVLFAYRIRNRWGTIGQSRDQGLFGRPPIFRSIRDLAWSYFDPYIDATGKVTAYQLANLDESGADWRCSSRNVWKAERYLLDLEHKPLTASVNRYHRVLERVSSGKNLTPQSYWW